MKLFFSVGEPSGDLHGANLIREIRRRHPDWQCVGYGGPRMDEAGCQLHADLTELAVMWFSRAMLNLPRFWNLVGSADRYFRHHRPDAVLLIDYPGFNWWIARRARAHGVPVFFYGAPQMWAWAGWRVGKMRRLVDHVLCKLPFEADWYRQRGCQATYVGHPYFDELSSRTIDSEFVADVVTPGYPLVTILPGSRSQEVAANLPAFLQAAVIIQQQVPGVKFAVAAFNDRQAESCRGQLAEFPGLNAGVFEGRTPELIQAATACLACSGSVSLELLYHLKPSVIHYKISRPAFAVQRYFRKVRFITLANLLATDDRYCTRGEVYDPDRDDVPFPEYLTCEDRSSELARHISAWIRQPESRRRIQQQLRELHAKVAGTGASRRAVDFLEARLAVRRSEVRTHHVPCRVA